MTAENAVEGSQCPNCGSAAGDNFCPRCGQEMISLRLSIRDFVHEFLDDHVGWSTRVPRTVWRLLAKPGFLTREFIEGRRVRYLSPLRLYLTFSVLFFLVAANPPHWGKRVNPKRATARDSAETSNSVARARRQKADSLDHDLAQRIAAGKVDTSTWKGQLKARSVRRSTQLSLMNQKERNELFIGGMMRDMPKAMFVILPLFALMLHGVMWRPRRFYAEHLIFALHVHAFMFAALGLAVLAPWGVLKAAMLFWSPVYFVLAMRTAYGGSLPRNFAKSLVIGMFYFAALVLAATGVGLALFLFG